MGLSAAFGIGQTALAAYQAALQVIGNNIANAGTPGYTRTTAELNAVPGASSSAGQFGDGVLLASIRRNVSEALQARLRTALSDRESASTQQSNLSRVEGVFDPLGDSNLGSLMAAFFKSVGDLQNNPQDIAARGIVLNAGQALAQRIQDVRGSLLDLRTDLNSDIAQAAQQGDALATKIASLNTQIVVAEAGGKGQASALRDQRDGLLGDLSQLFNITSREQPSGAVNVYLGNEALVQNGDSQGLKATNETDANGLPITVVRFTENNAKVSPTGGQVAGLIATRDTHVTEPLDRLDKLAASLIEEVNKIHAGGKGLQGFSSLTGTTAVFDPTQPLSSATNGWPFLPKTGSFFIDVKDTATGAVTRTQIHVDLDGIGSDSTLNSVAADISANVPNVTATVLADGRLQLTAGAGTTFSFADDTSNFLASAGLNTFFTGKNAADISVNSLLASTPSLLGAARSDLPGDGSNATALAGLQDQIIAGLGGASLNGYYTALTSDIAVRSSDAKSQANAGGVIFDSLTAQRESLSGVNLDEEAVSMISYQRAFEGAARYMNVVNDMMQVLLGLVK